MTFANAEGGLHINLHDIKGDDVIKKLLQRTRCRNPGCDEHKEEVKAFLQENCIGFARIGTPSPDKRTLSIADGDWKTELDINALRDTWYKTSYLLDRNRV